MKAKSKKKKNDIIKTHASLKDLASMIPLGVMPGESAYIHWSDFSDVEFSDPFFNQTIERVFQDNARPVIRTLLSRLRDVEALFPGRDPDGFICHLSRCGSTLITAVAKSISGVEALSEPPICSIFNILDMLDTSDDEKIEYFKLWVRAIARSRTHAKTFLIKFDLSAFKYHHLIRNAFPDVPWVFLYRNPKEIIASNISKQALWLTRTSIPPGMRMLCGIPIEDAENMESPLVAISKLEGFMKTAVEHLSQYSLMIDYRELPEAIWELVLPHFGLNPGAEDIASMQEKARWDSKEPNQEYRPDNELKRQALSAEVTERIDDVLMPLYRLLQDAKSAAS